MNNMVNEQDEPEQEADIVGDREYPPERYVDEDAEYERMRDDAGEELSKALKELIKSFIEGKTSCYSGESHREKLLEHMISELQFELENLKEKEQKK